MRILLVLLLCTVATTCGIVFCEGSLQTMAQYAFFLTIVVSGLVLAGGVADSSNRWKFSPETSSADFIRAVFGRCACD